VHHDPRPGTFSRLFRYTEQANIDTEETSSLAFKGEMERAHMGLLRLLTPCLATLLRRLSGQVRYLIPSVDALDYD
jgi:hypothetical protein